MSFVARQFLLATAILLAAVHPLLSQEPLRFRDGDRVVLLGATFIERAQQFGHLEAVLTGLAPGRDVTFRNLGWSGDTVFADSRGIFDSPEQGYQRLIEQINSERPSVILICYGQNEALDDSLSAEQFRSQYARLISDLQPRNARIVLLSPHMLFPTTPPIPSPSRFNAELTVYAGHVRQVAVENNVGFVDLMTDFTSDVWQAARQIAAAWARFPPDLADHPDLLPAVSSQWTVNGMHLTDAGYRAVAIVVANRLTGGELAAPTVKVDLGSRLVTVLGGEVRNARWSDDEGQQVRFEYRPHQLSPLPLSIQIAGKSDSHISGEVSHDGGLQPLQPIDPASASDVRLLSTGIDAQYEQLRQLIVRKNELYFHRWRPQNITYLFGFRKHEQGQNAAEIPKFDPLIKALEDQISEIKNPRWQTVLLQIRRDAE
jgi:lysophospholipase L1-like esterase